MLSYITCETVNIYNIEANNKVIMRPSEDMEKLPANSVYYFRASPLEKMQLELGVSKGTSINFDVEIHFFDTEPTDEEVVNGSGDNIKNIESTSTDSDDTQDLYKYSLPSSEQNKQFIVIVITIKEEIESFSVLLTNGESKPLK